MPGLSTDDTHVSPTAMRDAMGRFATGVAVVTTVDEESRPAGCTISALASVSLTPPLLLICIGKERLMHERLATGTAFVVNVLSADQAELAKTFAQPSADRFTYVSHRPGALGPPLVDGAIAHLQCARHAVLDGGDHSIILGRVIEASTYRGEPLLYSQGAFLDIKHQAWRSAVAEARHEWLLTAPW